MVGIKATREVAQAGDKIYDAVPVILTIISISLHVKLHIYINRAAVTSSLQILRAHYSGRWL